LIFGKVGFLGRLLGEAERSLGGIPDQTKIIIHEIYHLQFQNTNTCIPLHGTLGKDFDAVSVRSLRQGVFVNLDAEPIFLEVAAKHVLDLFATHFSSEYIHGILTNIVNHVIFNSSKPIQERLGAVALVNLEFQVVLGCSIVCLKARDTKGQRNLGICTSGPLMNMNFESDDASKIKSEVPVSLNNISS
jgi:hypothetical protein